MAEERIVGHTYTKRITLDAAETRVRYRDELHLKKLYVMLHDWFVEEKWVDRKDEDWPEHFYILRETQRGNEMWIWWRFKKVPGKGEAGGKNSYYRYLLDVFWHVMGAVDIEVMHQGKKYKTNKADLEIVLTSKLEMDYMHEIGKGWRDSALLAPINDMFHKRIWKGELERRKLDLYRETYRLQETVKRFLGMRLYLPESEGQEFWPKLGSGEAEGLTQA